MIERKFNEEKIDMQGYHILISNDKEWVIAVSKMLGNEFTDAVNVYEYFEEKGYDFKFSSGEGLYFRRIKK